MLITQWTDRLMTPKITSTVQCGNQKRHRDKLGGERQSFILYIIWWKELLMICNASEGTGYIVGVVCRIQTTQGPKWDEDYLVNHEVVIFRNETVWAFFLLLLRCSSRDLKVPRQPGRKGSNPADSEAMCLPITRLQVYHYDKRQ